MTPEQLSLLIGEIYDCAIAVERWPGAMARVTQSIDAAYSAMHIFNTADFSSPRLVAHSPWNTERLIELSVKYAPKGIPGVENIYAAPLDTPQSTLDTVGLETFKETPFYKDWVQPQGLLDGAVVKFVERADRVGLMSCVTAESNGPVTAAQRRFMSLICPHLRRAALICDLLDNAKLQSLSFRNAIDALQVPLLLLDASARIVYANAQADEMLCDATLIRSANGQFAASEPRVTALLTDAVRRAATSPLELGDQGIGFALTDAGGTLPAIAYLLPLDASDVRPGIKGAVAGLFIARPRRNGLPPADLLQSLFGLTPAEARVMQMIGCGLRPADIARHLDNSENTVKSQLARVYAKMGASSQMEIARIIADLAPPFRQGN